MNQPETSQPVPAAVGRAEIIISVLLRCGVYASLATVLTGLAIAIARQPGAFTSRESYNQFIGPETHFPKSFPELFTGVCELRGRAIITLGILLLIATPILRVAVSIVTFIYVKDWTYVTITSVVLFLLILSLFLGHAE